MSVCLQQAVFRCVKRLKVCASSGFRPGGVGVRTSSVATQAACTCAVNHSRLGSDIRAGAVNSNRLGLDTATAARYLALTAGLGM